MVPVELSFIDQLGGVGMLDISVVFLFIDSDKSEIGCSIHDIADNMGKLSTEKEIFTKMYSNRV